MTELASVSEIAAALVILKTALGQTIELPAGDFNPVAQVDKLYQLETRRHSSGGCPPFSVLKVNEANIPGLSFHPSSGQAYQGAFILDVAKNCAADKTSASCEKELKLTPDFDRSQQARLANINARSFHLCSLLTLHTIWSDIDPVANQPRLIGCVNSSSRSNDKDDDEKEIAVEFLRVSSKGESETLQLRKVYP